MRRAAITRVAEAGAVGGSIEDYDPDGGLYALGRRRRAGRGGGRGGARARASRSCSPRAPRTTSAATPTSTTRSRACRPTSAPAPTCSTRPGSRTVEEIAAVCEAVSKPVNVLALPGLSIAEIFAAGAQRISLGSQLAWVAYAAAAEAATEIRDDGDMNATKVGINVGQYL